MSPPVPPKGMKDSGAEWVGQIPISWGCFIAKRLFSQKRAPKRKGAEQLASTQKYGVIPQSQYMEAHSNRVVQALSGTDSFKDVEKDDFVISLRSFEGGIERSFFNGCISPAYTVLQATREIDSGFYAYLFKSTAFVQALNTVMTGIREGKTITYEQFARLLVPVPMIEDQQSIRRVLDTETVRIDTLIEKKTRFIELLKEKRQALITHVVTKGLNPDAPMKDSGIEWLGKVPAHWRMMPIKYLARLGNGSTPSRDNQGYWHQGHFPWLTSSCVNLEVVDSADDFVTTKALDECHLPIVSPPAVLVGITGQGRTRGMATTLTITATINQHIVYVKPNIGQLMVSFLRRFLDQAYVHLRDESGGGGSTKGAITCEQIGNLRIPVPSLEEQELIVAALETQLVRISSLGQKVERSVSLLRERRSALITAAVTGKIDLGEAA